MTIFTIFQGKILFPSIYYNPLKNGDTRLEQTDHKGYVGYIYLQKYEKILGYLPHS